MGEVESGQEDRRKEKRFEVAKTFNVKFGDVEKLRKLFVRDISKGGMFLRTSKPRPKGTKVRVVLELPDGAQFPLDGEVVYARTDGGPVGNGVKFTEMRESIKMLLGQYVERLTKSAPASPQQAGSASPPGPASPAVAAPPVDIHRPELTPTEGLSVGGRFDEVFVQLDADLAVAERQSHGTAYDVLGIEPTATPRQVAKAAETRKAEFDPTDYGTRLPASLQERMRSILAKVDVAAQTLMDLRGRACVDLDLALLVPLVPLMSGMEVHDAFREELAARRANASAEQQADLDRAPSRRALAEGMQKSGNDEAAALLYRIALLYDSYDFELRQRLATIERIASES